MIQLTRLNGSPLFVNEELIKWTEAAPDTMLTLLAGEKIVVRESCADVMERVFSHRVCILAEVLRSIPAEERVSLLAGSAALAGALARHGGLPVEAGSIDEAEMAEMSRT